MVRQIARVMLLGDCCVKTLGCSVNLGFYYWQQVSQPSEIIFISALHSSHIHTRSFSCSPCKQAKAQAHPQCCRASAAPLASGIANKSDFFIEVCTSSRYGAIRSPKVLYGAVQLLAGGVRVLFFIITYTAGRPGSSEVPRNPLTRWDVSSIPANGIFLTKKTKN